jgi:hypothetical protein
MSDLDIVASRVWASWPRARKWAYATWTPYSRYGELSDYVEKIPVESDVEDLDGVLFSWSQAFREGTKY